MIRSMISSAALAVTTVMTLTPAAAQDQRYQVVNLLEQNEPQFVRPYSQYQGYGVAPAAPRAIAEEAPAVSESVKILLPRAASAGGYAVSG